MTAPERVIPGGWDLTLLQALRDAIAHQEAILATRPTRATAREAKEQGALYRALGSELGMAGAL